MNASFFTKAAASSLAVALSAGIAMAGTGRLLADGELWNAPRNRPGTPSLSIFGGPVRTYVAPSTVRAVTAPPPAPVAAPAAAPAPSTVAAPVYTSHCADR